MLYRHLNDLLDTKRVVSDDTWSSRRLVLRNDRMGYSLHDTVIQAGTEHRVNHKHHLETLYCIRGDGEVESLDDGTRHILSPGAVLAFNRGEAYILRAHQELQLVCVYNPALSGQEMLDDEGSFSRFAEETIFVIGLNDWNRDMLSTIDRAEHYNFIKLLDSDKILETQEYPIEEIIHEAKRQLRGHNGTIDGLIHYIDFPVSTIVPIICDSFDLPSATLESVLKCEHKYWSRVEQRAAVPDNVPSFAPFNPFDENPLEQLLETMDYPFWIKPVKSFSSYLGFRIDNAEQFAEALEEIRANIGRFSGPFNYLLDMIDMPSELENIGGEYCLAEGIIGGMQCTQEGYSFNGEVEVYGTVDSFREANLTTFSSYQYPTILPDEVLERMTGVTRRVIRQMGYDNAPFNIEYFWDRETDQLWLLEINTRISESHCELFQKVDGASHHQVAVELSTGRKPTFPHRKGKFNIAGKFFLREWEDAWVEEVPGEEVVRQIEQEIIPDSSIQIVAHKGQYLSDLMDQDSYSYRVALMWLGSADKQDLEKKRKQCEELLYEHFVFKREGENAA